MFRKLHPVVCVSGRIIFFLKLGFWQIGVFTKYGCFNPSKWPQMPQKWVNTIPFGSGHTLVTLTMVWSNYFAFLSLVLASKEALCPLVPPGTPRCPWRLPGPPAPWLKIEVQEDNFVFNCPSSSIPTLETDWFIHSLYSIHTKPIWTEFQNFDRISEFWQNFIILTEYHNFDRISQFWQNFTMLTEFHNFDEISQFWQDFTILTGFHNFDRISQFWPNFTILMKFHNVDQILQFWPNFTIFSCPSSSIPTFFLADSLL